MPHRRCHPLPLFAVIAVLVGVGQGVAGAHPAARSVPRCFGKAATIVVAGPRATGTRHADVIVVTRRTGATVSGGGGDDLICGGAGNDTLRGGDGNDKLSGGPGRDLLSGDRGNDTLVGGTGDDTLSGGPGTNTLSGQAGSDTFVTTGGHSRTDANAGEKVNGRRIPGSTTAPVIGPTSPPGPTTALLSTLPVTSGEFGQADYTPYVRGTQYPHSEQLECGEFYTKSVTVNTGGTWASLHTVLTQENYGQDGIDDDVEILGDGRVLYRLIFLGERNYPLDLDLRGVSQLTFRVTCTNQHGLSAVMTTPMVSTAASTHPTSRTGPTVMFPFETAPTSYTGTRPAAGAVIANRVALPDAVIWQTGQASNVTSTADYPIAAGVTRFTGFAAAESGVPDDRGSSVSVSVDGRLLGTYPVSGDAQPQPIDVDVTGGHVLTVGSFGRYQSEPVIGDGRLLTGPDSAPALFTVDPYYAP